MKDNSGQAFPVPVASMGTLSRIQGMTLHQWYMGLAMKANIERMTNDSFQAMVLKEAEKIGINTTVIIARMSSEYADSMIVEGNRDGK